MLWNSSILALALIVIGASSAEALWGIKSPTLWSVGRERLPPMLRIVRLSRERHLFGRFVNGPRDYVVSCNRRHCRSSSDNVYPIDSSAGILFQGTGNTNFFANIFAPTGQTLGVGTSDAWFSATNGAGYLWGSLGFAGVCSYCVADGKLTITQDNVSATPIPATWGMMLLGLGVLGFLGFRRRQGSSLAAA